MQGYLCRPEKGSQGLSPVRSRTSKILLVILLINVEKLALENEIK
jgi:hypothetical protein